MPATAGWTSLVGPVSFRKPGNIRTCGSVGIGLLGVSFAFGLTVLTMAFAIVQKKVGSKAA